MALPPLPKRIRCPLTTPSAQHRTAHHPAPAGNPNHQRGLPYGDYYLRPPGTLSNQRPRPAPHHPPSLDPKPPGTNPHLTLPTTDGHVPPTHTTPNSNPRSIRAHTSNSPPSLASSNEPPPNSKNSKNSLPSGGPPTSTTTYVKLGHPATKPSSPNYPDNGQAPVSVCITATTDRFQLLVPLPTNGPVQ